MSFFRFPHTPHLTWLGPGQPRDDKVLSPMEAREFLAGDVVVEEKVDGANLGFSVDAHGVLRAQNRGSYIDLDAPQGQWKPLKRWLSMRRAALEEALRPELMLFGEWCHAVHSVRYTRLPDWFLAFDVYDRAAGVFWSVDRRDALARSLDIAVVPELARGKLRVEELTALLGASRLTDGPAEGVYVRRETDGQLTARAKVVRAEFVQAIGEHWSKRRLEVNAVEGGRDSR
ncbi:RNA ligase family protein [Gemmatimonas aurantiaca]|uniref:RNA ligase family protein n=1 Tax=Gemmatimonas aurantiaca TaxID=173480 RepID=UPI00301DDFB6